MKNVAPLFPLFLAAFVSLVHAEPAQPDQALESFEDRVRLAQAAETDEELKTYQPAMLKRNGRRLTRTMRSCSAAALKSEAKAFVLVADITPQGKATAVEVQPATKVAQCFAKGFSSLSYPKPPKFPNRPGFPVTMKVRVGR